MVPRSGLWASKVFATFATFIDEAPSSQPATAPERTMLEVQLDDMTRNPISSDCARIAWLADGSTQTTPFKPGLNPKDFLEWFKAMPSR